MSAATTLWWVRHAPTHHKGMVGWSDIAGDVSDAAAIARLAAHLPAGALVTSSDLARATVTADAIARGRRRLPPDPALREINFGAWELRRHDEIEAVDPAAQRAFWESPGDSAPPGGESWNAVAARVSKAADALVAAHAGADIVVVAHFGAILTQVQRALGVDTRSVFAHRLDNLSVTRLTHEGGEWRAGAINHCP